MPIARFGEIEAGSLENLKHGALRRVYGEDVVDVGRGAVEEPGFAVDGS
jgi:hypothetical protein